MTVKELIKELKKYDENFEVLTGDKGFSDCPHPIIYVVKINNNHYDPDPIIVLQTWKEVY